MISFAREGCLAGYRRITVGEWLLKEYGHICMDRWMHGLK